MHLVYLLSARSSPEVGTAARMGSGRRKEVVEGVNMLEAAVFSWQCTPVALYGPIMESHAIPAWKDV